MSADNRACLNKGDSPRTLVVDDESSVRDLFTRWLCAEGHRCAQASNAMTAWEHLQENEADLVILDIRMPGRSGLQLLQEIKQWRPDTAVIIATGVEEARVAIQTLTRGAWGYLIKPVERENLLREVRAALQRRRQRIRRRACTRTLTQKVVRQTVAIRRAHENTIHRLVSASLYRDEETGAHIRRTGLFSGALAKAAGWSATMVARIRLAAPMHDVGKIGIPDAILRKPGPLTPEEFEIVKTHTVIGAELLADSHAPVLRMAREIAHSHHERWDGRGYPRGLAGPAIPESARVVAIVDAYDALTHDRVYRPALPDEEAVRMMRDGLGTHFDPRLLPSFFSILGEVRQIADGNRDEAVSPDLPRHPLARQARTETAAQMLFTNVED